MTRKAMCAERDHPQIGFCGWSTYSPICPQGCQDTHQETQKGGVHHSKGITEAGFRPLLRQLSPTHQDAAPHHADLPWHWPPESLPCWTEDFICPAAHLAPEILPCKTLITPLPTVLSPGPADRDSGPWVQYPPILSCDVITDCF